MECPKCKLINPESALRCDCGYSFPKKVSCPKCGRIYPETTLRCNCGYLFPTNSLIPSSRDYEPSQEEINRQKKRSRNKKIIIILSIITTLCLLICGITYFGIRKAASDMLITDQDKLREMASQITNYEIPAGYHITGGTSALGIYTVAFTDSSEKNMIWLIQSPSNSAPDVTKFLQDGLKFYPDQIIQWTVTDSSIYLINGGKSAITKYTGVDQKNRRYQAWAGNFVGKGGGALVVIVGPESTWNPEAAEAFLQSLK